MTRNESVKDISKIIKVSEVWVRELAKKGRIPATKKGHYWFFNSIEVKEIFYKDNTYGKNHGNTM